MTAFPGVFFRRGYGCQPAARIGVLLCLVLVPDTTRALDNPETLADSPSVEASQDSPIVPAVALTHFGLTEVVTAAFLAASQEKTNAEVSEASQLQAASATLETISGSDADSVLSLSAESIANFRAEVEPRMDLEEAVKSQILGHLDHASGLLQQLVEAEQRQIKLKSDRDNGPTLIAELKAELEKPAPSSEPQFPQDASVAELDRLRLVDLERLEEARKNLEGWETKAKTRAEKRLQMPALIETARKQLEESQKSQNPPATEAELPLLTRARKLEQQAQQSVLAAQLEVYLLEQLRYEALNELYPLQRDQFTRVRNALERKSERWKEVLNQARISESERQRIEARKRLEQTHPALLEIAARNSWITQYRQEHLHLRSTWRAQQAAVNESLDTLQKKFKEVTDRVERVGLTTAIGLTLRNQKTSLPQVHLIRRQQIEALEEFERLQLEQLQLDDERKTLDDIDSRLDRMVNSINTADVSDDEFRKMTRELLVLQRDYLDAILSDLESSLDMLVDKEFSCRQLTEVIRQYDGYIDQRILWIRSISPVNWTTPRKTAQSVSALADRELWQSLMAHLANDFRSNTSLYMFLMLWVGVFSYGRWKLIRSIPPIEPRPLNSLDAGVQRISITFLAQATLAICWPLVMGFMAWRISAGGSNLGAAIGSGLLYSAVLLWVLTIAGCFVQRGGLADSFRLWPESVVKSLRRNLGIYTLGGVPLCTIFVASHQIDDANCVETLGRFAFILFCGLVSALLATTLGPRGAIVGTWLRATPQSLIYRTRWLWYPTAVAAPVSMAILATLGYLYTAEQLMLRLELTLGLLLALVVGGTLANRWLMAARRRLAIQQARLKREAELSVTADPTAAAQVMATELEQLDLSAVNRQVVRLVQVASVGLLLSGCWIIWDQVFPALQVFTQVEVWSTITSVAEVVDTPTGPQVQEASRLRSITRENLIVAIAVFTVCIFASRNLPGLMELSVLQRLPLDSGSRNAIKLLTGYAFMAAGIVISTNIIGLQWGSVQWLVAALTVGLGFGLQEIFANFVSGLIILFERPVRIGDVVTIDGVTGTITRIRSRATTITDWDRKEFIVPNKEFVTGRLLNWTLTDKMTRILINVGIAYGSDVRLALQLLKEIADQHPLVLNEPAPSATFDSFGESCLNLILRSFLPSLENRSQVLTDLNMAINDRFLEHGIEMAFPQRDLHIRTVSPQASEAATLLSLPSSNPMFSPGTKSPNIPSQSLSQEQKEAA